MFRHMKSFLALLMALMMLFTGAIAEQPAFTPGSYSASANGMMGEVKVDVVFTDNTIESVTITEQNETPSIAQAALDKIPSEIVQYQSLAVDTVTGATMTSNAILDAVKQCVTLAGGSVDALMVPIVKEEKAAEVKELEADIVIVGAGGAGLSAAISASEHGASVIVVEKMAAVGGTTALSSGFVQVPGTQQQADAGITGDTWEIYANDIYNRGSQLGNKEIIDTICKNAYSMMEWLAGNGINWNPQIQNKHGEDVTYLRTIAPIAPEGHSGALGAVLTNTMASKAQELGAQIIFNAKAHTILMEDGKAVGIAASDRENGIEYTIKAAAVIVATGGFAANSEMYNRFNPDFSVENSDYRAFSGSLGEGVVMAEAAGAALVDMQQAKILVSSGGPAAATSNAIYVNENGERFVDETAKTEIVTAEMIKQAGDHGYMIYDSQTLKETPEQIAEMVAAGSVVAADTLVELAQAMGMDAAALEASVASYNKIIAGEADAFGRVKAGSAIEVGPFYAAERHVRLHYTNGGIKIDKDAHVYSTADAIIPGLYAAGETTGGVHGTYRVGANALSEVLVMGRIAGATAVAEMAK